MNNDKNTRTVLRNKLLSGNFDFDNIAIEIFRHQAEHNKVYKDFVNHLGIDVSRIREVEKIPFLPISAFKEYKVMTGDWQTKKMFMSSGTTQNTRSTHHFRDLDLYDHISVDVFQSSIQVDWKSTALFALLPSYLDNGDSSLIYMVDHFMKKSRVGSFFNKDIHGLKEAIEEAKKEGLKVVLFGVSYALIDLVESGGVDLRGHDVFETGGMKGRRAEWIKPQLLRFLGEGLNCSVSSEYGMTELTSQFYAQRDGAFQDHIYAKVSIGDIYDPLQMATIGKTGVIRIIDLGNLDTCSFIQTQDLGRKVSDDRFEWIGRMQAADIRGCNLLYA